MAEADNNAKDIEDEIQVPGKLPALRRRISKIACIKVSKEDVKLAEKIATSYGVALGLVANWARTSDRSTSSFSLGIAALLAGLLALQIYIRHERRGKASINWWFSGSLVFLHLVAIVTALAFWGEGTVKRHVPSVLTLFETEFVHQNERGHVNYPSDFDTQVTYYYKLVQDLEAQSKFLTLYFPETPYAQQISADAAGRLPGLLVPHTSLNGKGDGQAYSDDNSQLKFTGVVIIYYEGTLSPDDLSAIRKKFAVIGVKANFRGTDYADMVGAGIMRGDLPQPPDYKMKDGLPCRVVPRKKPGAIFDGNKLEVPQGKDFTGFDDCKEG